MTLTAAAELAGPLSPAGVRAGADSGNPQLRVAAIAPDAHGTIGVWECQPGGWPVVDRSDTEVCVVLSGAATITDGETGTRHDLRAGDLLVLPVGWTGRWDVTETLRKVYVIY
ncbi:cupin domain-containing protein [Amycolatopsis sp. NPDC098790]|uniref:cupin domain-containing protein n=1 Tax=Amycolatopsis sp. NPDC098790 TaxID=3363939 RepID=UPI0038041843